MTDKNQLSQSLESAKKTIDERNKQRLEERRKEEEAYAKYLALEHGKLDEKLQFAKDIFDWGKEFVKSPEYREIQELKNLDTFGFLAGSDENKLWIYSGTWGHERDGDAFGCWSRFYIRPDCTFHYWAGYKWMPTGPSIDFHSPKKLASKLSHIYISGLHEFLLSDRVYERLSKKVEEYSKRRF